MTDTPAPQSNLDKIEMILEECGATTVRTIEDASHIRLEFVRDDHRLMMPFADGVILIARFPPQKMAI
ncbi:MAG: hypothetical protein H8E90_08665 [Anaerolineales bacterium]|nr:hypothetical protein [Anaerolineales bacterium]